MDETDRALPFPVWLAAMFGFVKAAFLGLMGVIGIIAWDSVSNPWGFGALALAILFGLASTMLLRGSRVARIVLAGLAVIGFVGAIVYIFVGPPSAILPSLGTAVLAALVVVLMYVPRSAKEYFRA